MPSRSFNLGYGSQGWYGLQFYYDGVPFNQYKDLHTIYDNSGAGTLNVKGTLGYNFTDTTRLMSTFQYGLQLQNAPYTPGTLNSFLLTKGLSSGPGSLNGQVRTLFGNATLTSQPLDKLDLKLSYTIDKRDNDTAKQLIQSTYVDSWRTYANEIGTPASALGVPNFIYSSSIQTVKGEAGYRILPKTKLTLGFVHKDTTRTLSDVNSQQENAASARSWPAPQCASGSNPRSGENS